MLKTQQNEAILRDLLKKCDMEDMIQPDMKVPITLRERS